MITTPSSPKAHAPLSLGLLLLAPIIAIVVYFSALDGALIHDGARVTVMNPQVTGAADWAEVWNQSTPAPPLGGDVYRPVLGSLLRIQWAMWGKSPSSFHSVNLMLWAAVIVVFLLLMSRLTANPLARAVGVFLLALHPIASQSVYSVAGQGALLSLLACLLALWLAQRARDGRLSPTGLLLSLPPVCLVAFGAHEMGLLLPLWLLAQWLLIAKPTPRDAMDLTIATPGGSKKLRRKKQAIAPQASHRTRPAALNPLWIAAPVFAILAVYLLMRYVALDGLLPASALQGVGWPETLGSRFVGGFSVLALAIQRLLCPIDPTFIYSPDYDLALPGAWLGVAVLALALVALAIACRRSKLIALALILTISPLLGLLHWLPLPRFFSEGPLLFVLPGLALLAAFLIERVLAPGEEMPPVGWRGRLVGLVCLIAFGAMAWHVRAHGPDWKTTDTFWEAEALSHPENPYPLIHLLEEAIRQNKSARVTSLAKRALAMSNQHEINRLHQLQASFYGLNKDKKALAGLLDDILASDQVYKVAYARSLAAIARTSNLKQLEEALWQRELSVNPEDFDAHYSLAEIAFENKDIAQAIERSSQAIQHAPLRLKARAMALYGKMLIEGGHITEGERQLQIALRNDPTLYEPYIYLIRLKWGNKDYEAAERLINQCNAKAKVTSYVDLAILYTSMLAEQGKTLQTLELMRKWVDKYPGDVQLHLFVARYLVDNRFYPPAKQMYMRLRPSLKGAQLSEVWTGLARVAKLNEGNTPIAIECLKEALKAKPDNEEAKSLLKRFQASRKQATDQAAPGTSETDEAATPPGKAVAP